MHTNSYPRLYQLAPLCHHHIRRLLISFFFLILVYFWTVCSISQISLSIPIQVLHILNNKALECILIWNSQMSPKIPPFSSVYKKFIRPSPIFILQLLLKAIQIILQFCLIASSPSMTYLLSTVVVIKQGLSHPPGDMWQYLEAFGCCSWHVVAQGQGHC